MKIDMLLKKRNQTKSFAIFQTISEFVFQVYQHLFTRPSIWSSWLMVFCEGPSSADNVQVLALGCCSTISSKASSSTTENLPDFGLLLRQVLPSLKCLNQFCTTHSLTAHRPSTSWISFVTSFPLNYFFFTFGIKWTFLQVFHYSLSKV